MIYLSEIGRQGVPYRHTTIMKLHWFQILNSVFFCYENEVIPTTICDKFAEVCIYTYELIETITMEMLCSQLNLN